MIMDRLDAGNVLDRVVYGGSLPLVGDATTQFDVAIMDRHPNQCGWNAVGLSEGLLNVLQDCCIVASGTRGRDVKGSIQRAHYISAADDPHQMLPGNDRHSLDIVPVHVCDDCLQ